MKERGSEIGGRRKDGRKKERKGGRWRQEERRGEDGRKRKR